MLNFNIPEQSDLDAAIANLQAQIDAIGTHPITRAEFDALAARVAALEGGEPDPPPPPAGGTYSVGPGQQYANFAALPWPLADGDVVDVYAGTYNEKFQLSRGVHLRGVLGPSGERPIIDGSGATTASPYVVNQTRGLITLGKLDSDAYGAKPTGVRIENLLIRGASNRSIFTDSGGAQQTYAANAAGIYGERASDVEIINCEVEDCGNGIFAASGGDEATTCRNWTLDGNHIHNYGTVGSDKHHGTYIEAAGVVYRNNTYGDRYPGALGSMLKDRSSGTLIEGNHFAGSGARTLDLVDRENGVLLNSEPGYGLVTLRNNTYDIPANTQTVLIHFGGDTGVPGNYKTNLVIEGDSITLDSVQSQSWRKIICDPETDAQKVDFHGFTVQHVGNAELSVLELTGVAEFHDDGSAITPPWLDHRTGSPSAGSQVIGREFVGTV